VECDEIGCCKGALKWKADIEMMEEARRKAECGRRRVFAGKHGCERGVGSR
jgi:hypothetical protein